LGTITEPVFGQEIEFESEFIVLLSMFLFGSFFCGWACPFGNIAYFIGKLGKRILPKSQVKIPPHWDRPLRYLKIALLVAFIWVFVSQGISYFDDHAEMYQATRFTQGYFAVKIFTVFILPLVSGTFYCRYLCYQKAAYNLLNKLSLTHIERVELNCIDCKRCDHLCPMDVSISSSKAIRGRDCITCFSCLDEGICPKEAKAIEIRFLGQRTEPLQYARIALSAYVALTLLALIYLPRG
jgi:polyferredoxin